MSSYLLALWVNRDSGEPYTGPDRIGHVVRVGPNPNMPIIQEFTDGGRFEHEDCAPASIMSRLIEGKIITTIDEIEALAGTGLNGTHFDGCLLALEHFGVASSFSQYDCPSGSIMNPMIPTIVPPTSFPAYLKASQGGHIVMADPIVPTPPKPPQPGEIMKATFFQGPDSTIYLFVPTGTGKFIPMNEIAVVEKIGAEWSISSTPIQLNAADVASWRAAYPQA